MMRIDPAPEPQGFDAKIRKPGLRWLKKNSSLSPKAYWNSRSKLSAGKTCREELYDLYHGICAYSLFRILDGVSFQVEHFIPKNVHPELAYEWGNYRLVGGLNQRKGTETIVDPFKIPIDACDLDLPSGRIRVSDSCVHAQLWDETINRVLHLNEGAPLKNRAKAYSEYSRSRMTVWTLSEDYPFVAYEMLRKRALREEDAEACRRTLHGIGFSWVAI